MENLNSKRYWIWFSLIKGLGCVKKNKLLQLYKTPEKIYNLTKEELLKIDGIGDKVVSSILQSKNEKLIDYHIKYMKENNIDIINIYEKNYPQLLKKIYDSPVSLYIRGDKRILNGENIGIVGCRDCSDYGKKAAKYFAYNLSRKGVNIISGLAKGVDSYAHLGAVGATVEIEKYENDEKIKVCCKKMKEDCGKTIAVLGNGLDVIYPKENVELARKIIRSGGAIVSEYPCGIKPDRMSFPARNRIISGISNGVIVVEAKEKSRYFNYS